MNLYMCITSKLFLHIHVVLVPKWLIGIACDTHFGGKVRFSPLLWLFLAGKVLSSSSYMAFSRIYWGCQSVKATAQQLVLVLALLVFYPLGDCSRLAWLARKECCTRFTAICSLILRAWWLAEQIGLLRPNERTLQLTTRRKYRVGCSTVDMLSKEMMFFRSFDVFFAPAG